MDINDILEIKPESETRAETTKAAIKGEHTISGA